MSDEPKSALEIVLARLRKQDADAGVSEHPISEEQRADIAEAKSVYEARVAERRIMHQSAIMQTFDPAERQALDDALRRDLERFESERESKVRKIRAGS